MARKGIGNNSANTRTGTSGDDILSGTGGSFKLIGGKGNDLYIIDDSGDTIDEKNNGGTDHAVSYVDFVLGNHIEDLTLAGDARIGTGNDSDNTITGNSNGNTLDGRGGDDTLIGGAGADFIDGGDGVDTAVFTGASGDYVIERDGLDLLVMLNGGAADILRNVEYLSFDDGVIAVSDIGDTPGDLPLPVAIDDAGSADEDGSVVISVLGNDIGDGIVVTSATNGTKGLVTINADGTVTYRPVDDANGTDSFTYSIADSLGRTSTATVSVDIASLNDAPVANADGYSVVAREVFTSPGSVLDNDSDPDGDALTVSSYQSTSQAGGSVQMNADGTFTYTAAAGFAGTDSFIYTVSDGNGGQASANVSLTVAPAAPLAVPDSVTVAEDGAVVVSVLSNDTGDGLSVLTATNGAIGSVTVNGDGTITYSPVANANGADSFSYTVTDSVGRASTASVSVDVTAVNDAPAAKADSYSALAGEVYTSTGSVLANDNDIDGDPLTVSGYDATSQGGGTVQMNADGTFTYTPVSGFSGADSFTYSISDGNGGQASATVSIGVEAATAVLPYYVEGLIGSDVNRFNYPGPAGAGTVVTYAFLTEFPAYYGADQVTQDSFVAFSDQQQETTRAILAMIESFTGLTFIETSADQAGMTFGLLTDLGGGSAGLPQGDGVGSAASDVWIDADFAGSMFEPLTYQYQILLHEIGHAVGLTHPDLPVAEENQQYSVMDILPHPTFGAFPVSYQLYDIAALQYLYGANTSYASGDDVYTFSTLDGSIQVIWDGGGHDVIDMSGAAYAVNLDLGEGAFSTVAATGINNLAIAFGTVIEDVIGSDYNDVIVGNDAANRLTGGAGDDLLTGWGGADTFAFDSNWGNDTITDFVRGQDALDFAGARLNFADLEITSLGGDTLITIGNNSVTLTGVVVIDETDLIV